jgi:hypothetical protein
VADARIGRHDLGWLAGVAGVRQVAQRDGSVEVRGTGPVLAEVGAALVGHGLHPADLRVDQLNLEDVFLSITGAQAIVSAGIALAGTILVTVAAALAYGRSPSAPRRRMSGPMGRSPS